MDEIASKAEVEKFLSETKFSGYQSLPLPHGLRVPGRDRSRAVNFYLSDVSDKALLDVGTYYGMYPCEAMERAASRAVGIELDPERYAIAKRISELNGSKYNIIQSRVEDLALEERFDIVLFLNVLHHVLDPIKAVKRVAKLSRDKVIIEFCLPWDPEYLEWLGRAKGKRLGRALAIAKASLIKLACKGLPMMAVGNREYHRTFYFSPEAFENIFVLHHKVFKSIQFLPSPSNAYRHVAICSLK